MAEFQEVTKTNADKFREVFGVEPDFDFCIYNRGFRDCEDCKVNCFWNDKYKEPEVE